MPPPWGTSVNIRINLIPPETRVIGLHFCCWWYGSIYGMGLSSFKFLWWALKDTSFLQQNAYRPFKVIRGRLFWHNRKGVCDFLLVINSNFGHILHRFWDMVTYWLKIVNFFLPHSHWMPLLGVKPLEFLDEFFTRKTRVLGLSVGEDFVILACVVFTQCQGASDGRTDRHSYDG